MLYPKLLMASAKRDEEVYKKDFGFSKKSDIKDEKESWYDFGLTKNFL